MTTKEEAGCSGERGGVPPTPAPRHYPRCPPPPSITSPGFQRLDGGCQEVRTLRVVGEGREEKDEGGYSAKTVRQLARINLVVAAIIFLCQLVVAACLCRPVVIMGGVWVGILVLVQAILGLRAANTTFSHALVVGHAWVSGVVCNVCLAAAGYLFSGHLTLACVSTFHSPDHASVVRLYIVEVAALVASLPCLTAAIVSLLGAALSARAACPPKQKKTEAPFVLYLPRWGESVYGSDQQTSIHQSQARNPVTSQPSVPSTSNQNGERDNSPPPAYNQIAEESFA
ncbi:uncharacterized protein LOC121873592 isoform X2 [Homarus americanus]|uniref:uncharacterized protein LOC121873592 isoform X2 n=1 Tax=Homarus americanus TaxID=6706 RepID=UPI001C43AB36|nr:uncharacterized protein LOC121873592 isoform X2 [Homarus americanus]